MSRLRFAAVPFLAVASFVVAAALASAPERERSGPPIRVGVAVGAEGPLSIESDDWFRIVDTRADSLLGLTNEPLSVEVRGTDVAAMTADGTVRATASVLAFEPEGAGAVRVDGRPYRGVIEVFAVEDSLLNAVNELPLEDYLLGVVPIEIGPRTDEEFAAVAAQAVAARTYAVAHLRAREEMGFDVFGSVEDQAYGGMAAERPEATRAVRETAGRVLMYEGLPIRAMYHSTCGGHTSAVEEVLDREPAPYLRPVADTAPDGTDYCAASPRHRWVDTLGAADLNGRVMGQIQRIFGASKSDIGEIEGLRVVERTPSGRVAALAVRGTHSEFVLERLDIRIALQSASGRILGSTDFEVHTLDDGTIELHGRGYGHGSGMCQWGAIGRARAGQDWTTILETYYAGAELVSVY
jgi:stage II sporulation protein D